MQSLRVRVDSQPYDYDWKLTSVKCGLPDQAQRLANERQGNSRQSHPKQQRLQTALIPAGFGTTGESQGRNVATTQTRKTTVAMPNLKAVCSSK